MLVLGVLYQIVEQSIKFRTEHRKNFLSHCDSDTIKNIIDDYIKQIIKNSIRIPEYNQSYLLDKDGTDVSSHTRSLHYTVMMIYTRNTFFG